MRGRRRPPLWLAALFLAYALALFVHTSFAAGGSDSSGYVNAARLLATGRAHEPIRGLTRLGLSPDFAPVFTPLGYTASRELDQPMSDVLATAWALAAVLTAFRTRAGSSLWAIAAGVAFGIGVLVRPTNALLLLPLLVALPPRAKSWLLFAAGGIPFGVFHFLYGAAAFGSPWTTGYQSVLSEGMALANFPARARHYGYWTARLLSPWIPLGWLAVAADRRAALSDRAVLLTWFAAFFLFYSFFAPYEAWWYTRFLLPALPALILGALVTIRDFVLGPVRRPTPWRIALVGVLVICALAFELRFVAKERVHRIYRGESIYPQACALAQRRVPAKGIVVSMQMSGALHYYTDATYAMWNVLLPERFEQLRVSTESRGFRWYALLAPFETEYVLKNLPGEWREIDRVEDVVLWELPPLWPGRPDS